MQSPVRPAPSEDLQLTLFDSRTERDTSAMGGAFRKFHRENPEVYRELRALALELLDRGRRRYGMKGLFEIVRWRRALRVSDDDGFKLNNNFTAFFSRILMHNEPTLAGFFALRESIADGERGL